MNSVTFCVKHSFEDLVKSKKSLVSVCIGCLILPMSSVHALDWNQSVGANVTTGYDDNIFVEASATAIDTTFNTLGLVAGVEGRSETSGVQLSVALNQNEYGDSRVDDETTGEVSLVLDQKSERMDYGVTLSYLREPSIEAELLDTGIIANGTRDTRTVAPQLSYRASERSTFSLGLEFVDVSYDTVLFQEYQDNGINVGWEYGLDETSFFSIGLEASRFKPDNAADADTRGISFGYKVKPIEALEYGFSVGYTEVDDNTTQVQSGTTYGLEIIDTRSKTDTYQVKVDRSFTASGLGVFREEDNASFSWLHSFSERLQSLSNIIYSKSNNRDYVEIEPGLQYKLTENVQLSGSYRFRQQEVLAGRNESNSVFFTLSYNN